MKLVIYLRNFDDENDNPQSEEEIRNEILCFEDDEYESGCAFSTNSTSMICSERFNKYWVASNRRNTKPRTKIKYLKEKVISKNFYRRMKFDLDRPLPDNDV